MTSEFNGDLLTFEELKDRLRVLERNLHDIREQWQRIHNRLPQDTSQSQELEDLAKHELKTLEELRKLLHSAQRVMLYKLQRLNRSSMKELIHERLVKIQEE